MNEAEYSSWGGNEDGIGFATVKEGGESSTEDDTSSSGLSDVDDEDDNLSAMSADSGIDMSYPPGDDEHLPSFGEADENQEEEEPNFFLHSIDVTSLTKQILEIRELKVRKSHLLILDNNNRVFFIPPKRNGKIYSIPSSATQNTAKHIFFSPNTYHVLLTTQSGDVYYINTYLPRYKPRKLKTLRGINISAVRWDGIPTTISTEKETGVLLLGTEDSKLYQYELSIDPDRKKKRKASVPFKMLLDFHAQNILSNTGNTKIGRITNIVVRPCARGRRIFILVTTPHIIFEFDGPPFYEAVFETYQDENDFVLMYKEIPAGKEKHNELHVYGKGFAWLCSRGIYHGKLMEGSTIGISHLGDSEMIVLPRKRFPSSTDLDARSPPPVSHHQETPIPNTPGTPHPSTILSVGVNQYHLFVLYQEKFVAYLQPPSLVSSRPDGDSKGASRSGGGMTVRGVVNSKSSLPKSEGGAGGRRISKKMLKKQRKKSKIFKKKYDRMKRRRKAFDEDDDEYDEEDEDDEEDDVEDDDDEEDIKLDDRLDSDSDSDSDQSDSDQGMPQVPINQIKKMYEYKFNKGHGTPIKLVTDGGDIYVYTDSKLWRLEIDDLEKDVWKLYLDHAVKHGNEDMFDESLKLISRHDNDPRKRDAVLVSKADYLFNKTPEPDYDRAVKIYAQTSRSFEKVALKLYFQENKKHLITFLIHKLKVIEDVNRSKEHGAKTQIGCIIVWTVELFIDLLNENTQNSKEDGMLNDDDDDDGNNNDDDDDNNDENDILKKEKMMMMMSPEEKERMRKLKRRKMMMKKKSRRMRHRRGGIRMESSSELNLTDEKKSKRFEETRKQFEWFLKSNHKHLSPSLQATLFFLLSSHCRISELIFLATLVGSYEHVLDAYLTTGRYLNCLEYLQKHCCGENVLYSAQNVRLRRLQEKKRQEERRRNLKRKQKEKEKTKKRSLQKDEGGDSALTKKRKNLLFGDDGDDDDDNDDDDNKEELDEETKEMRKFESIWYKYIPKLLNNEHNNPTKPYYLSPEKIIQTLMEERNYFIVKQLKPGRFLPCLMKYVVSVGSEDLVLKYLSFVVVRLKNKEMCVHNLMCYLLAKKSEREEKEYYDSSEGQKYLKKKKKKRMFSSSRKKKINKKKKKKKKKTNKKKNKNKKVNKKKKKKTTFVDNPLMSSPAANGGGGDQSSSGLESLSDDDVVVDNKIKDKKESLMGDTSTEEEESEDNDNEEEDIKDNENISEEEESEDDDDEEDFYGSTSEDDDDDDDEDKSFEYEKGLLEFLQKSSKGGYDQTYALRICLEYHRVHSSIYLCKSLQLWPIAIEFALNEGMIDEAKDIASNIPSKQKDIKKNSWLRILKHIVEKKDEEEEEEEDEESDNDGSDDDSIANNFNHHNDVFKAVEMLKELNDTNNDLDLKLEDILPFFPSTLTLKVFKKEICSNLDKYKSDIDFLKRNMLQQSNDADLLRKDIKKARNRYFYIHPKSSLCDYCQERVIPSPYGYDPHHPSSLQSPSQYQQPEDFYLFPCAHKFHARCIVKFYENLPLSTANYSRRRRGGGNQQLVLPPNNNKVPTSSSSTTTTTTTTTTTESIDERLGEECPFCGNQMVDQVGELFFRSSLENKKLQLEHDRLEREKMEQLRSRHHQNQQQQQKQQQMMMMMAAGSSPAANISSQQRKTVSLPGEASPIQSSHHHHHHQQQQRTPQSFHTPPKKTASVQPQFMSPINIQKQPIPKRSMNILHHQQTPSSQQSIKKSRTRTGVGSSPGEILRRDEEERSSWRVSLRKTDYLARRRLGPVEESTDEEDRIARLDNYSDLSSSEIEDEKVRIEQNKKIKRMKKLTKRKRFVIEENITFS